MVTPHSKALTELIEKAKDEIAIKELRDRLMGLVEGERTNEELTDWRLQRGVLKKVCDEMFPVSRFFTYSGITKGTLSFPQDSKVPDAWWRTGNKSIGIEVTISQGRARHILGRELTETNDITRGYLGLQDDAKPKEVEAAKEQKRAMYVTAQALATAEKGIRRCLKQKNDEKYKGMILLIEAPLSSLPTERWDAMVPPLVGAAKDMPFAEVHVLGKADKLMGLRIK